jgi:hypothetical protein
MEMKKYSGVKKFKIGAFAFLVATTSLVAIPSSNAADIPTVRLVSPAITASTSVDRTTNDLQIPAQKWYREGSKSLVITSPEGKELTLKFLVTKDGTTPWAGQSLILQVGAPYSGSNGTWDASGTEIGPQAGTWSDAAAGQVTAITGADGFATFTFKNKNTGAMYKTSDVLSGSFQFSDNANRRYTQFKPTIAGLGDYTEPYLIKEIINVDIVQDPVATTPTAPTAPTATPTPTATPVVVVPKLLPSMRLISPAYGPANSVDTTGDIAQYYSAKTRAYYTYVAAGTTLTLKYKVTSDGTAPLANTEVTLQANAQYSGSKANWLAGTTKVGASSDNAPGAQLKAKTDAAGEVTFVVKNTDTTGTEAKPASPNAAAPAMGRLYGTFKPVITGYGDKEADVDLVTFDVYAAAKATTITCIKGKVTKKVTAVSPKCPAGYKKK